MKIKVACLGDSITTSYFIPDIHISNYPYLLQKLLGENFDVKNFGKVGSKISINYDENYYYNSNEYFKLLNFNPDIVIIILGTNDANKNFDNNLFINDYYFLISNIINNCDPIIYICTPIPILKVNLWYPNSKTHVTNEESITYLPYILKSITYIKNITNDLYFINLFEIFNYEINKNLYKKDGIHTSFWK